ncbi:MAG TPA: carboxypeptidase-like regulatory domain-containing protein [Fimbriimonas sp.]|nr:carboxypeptidase-like regulatory domain-containing protein [Fimbriimonas sp.]
MSACILAIFGTASADSITGVLREDVNGDGRLQKAEMGIPSALILVQRVDGTRDFGGFTDGKGAFKVDNLPAGRYRVLPLMDDKRFVTVPPRGMIIVDLPMDNPKPLTLGEHRPCLKLAQGSMVQATEKEGCWTWNVTYTNNGTFPISEIFFNVSAPVQITDPANPWTVNHISLSNALAPGKSITFNLLVCGVDQGACIDIPVLVYDRTMMKCCATTLQDFCTPEEDCFNLYDSKLRPSPAGGYVWNFCIQNLTGRTVNSLHLGGLRDPSGAVIGGANPSNIALIPPLAPNASACFSVKLNGVPPGTPVTVGVSLYDGMEECCSREWILNPPTSPTEPCEGMDASNKPNFSEWDKRWDLFTGRVAAITKAGWKDNPNNWANDDDNDYALKYLNISGYPYGGYETNPIWHVDANGPVVASYNGPPDPNNIDAITGKPYDLWTQKNLGHIFGLTIDDQANTYVTHFGLYPYSSGPVPMGKAANRFGSVLKVHPNTGQISVVAELPNDQNARPGLGNVTFDYDHKLLFVTNFNNGMIYRIDLTLPPVMYGQSWAANDVWGPFTPKTYAGKEFYNINKDRPGWVPLGERVFGIQYHCGRLYFGRWSRNNNDYNVSPNPNIVSATFTADNRIYSVGLDSSGHIDKSTFKAEPGLPGSLATNPVSDISFSPKGYMGTAECTVVGDYILNPASRPIKYSHSSESTEYRLSAGQWVEKDVFVAGGSEHNAIYNVANYQGRGDCNGGVDYDYYLGDGWLWFTMANARGLTSTPTFAYSAYGLVGFNPASSLLDPWLPNSSLTPFLSPIVIDYDKILGFGPKRFFGDVEIPITRR